VSEVVSSPCLPREAEELLEQRGEYALTDPDPELLEQLKVKTGEWDRCKKETFLFLNSSDASVSVNSNERAGVGAMLRHPEASIDEAHLIRTEGEVYISAIKADLPIGAVMVKEKSRESGRLSEVFRT